jgi:Flp pilus assembly protein TadG
VISTTFDDREERPAVRRHQERSSDERGQTLVEFAALLPVLCLLLFGIIQFGVVFHDYITVTDASRVGARKAAVSRIGGDKGDAAVAAAKEAGSSLNWATPGASVTCNADDWSKAGSDVRCTVNYPYSIDVLGMVVASGTLTSVTTERLE